MRTSPEEGAPLRLYFVAGEASGDRIGAELMQALDAACEARPLFFGVGGHAMEAQGLRSLFPMDELSLHGVADVAGAAPPPCGVLHKAPKHGQERRVDMPVIGPETVRGAARAGLNGAACEAERVLLLDAGETIRMADEAGLFLYGGRCTP